MFSNTYVRLTAWYVAIIMAISFLFSLWVYAEAGRELRFGLEAQATMIEMPLPSGVSIPARDFIETQITASRQRLLSNIFLFNLVVLSGATVGSYALAKRTLRPIKDALEAQHRFTADASHELRTPLAAMKTEIEVALRDKKLSIRAAKDALQSNVEEIDRLSGLAEGLLTLTQTEAPVELVPLKVHEIAQTVVGRLQSLAHAKQIEIQSELEPAEGLGDQASLEKILGILLDNAIKYSPPHTIITVSSYSRDAASFVAVADQGVGIKATELPHIFDRFYRADSSRSKTHVVGYGLGLAIAQKQAEQMKAKLGVTSTPGKGSRFTIELAA